MKGFYFVFHKTKRACQKEDPRSEEEHKSCIVNPSDKQFNEESCFTVIDCGVVQFIAYVTVSIINREVSHLSSV